MFYAVTYDNPGILCFGMTSSVKADGNKFFYVPEYSANKEECDKKTNELNTAVSEFLKTVPENSSDYEKNCLHMIISATNAFMYIMRVKA